MEHKFELGPIRPPSESASLLLRITRNCPWNRCSFCGVYKGESFGVRSVEEIKADIDAMYYYKEKMMRHQNADGSPNYTKMVEELHTLNGEAQHYYFSVLNFLANGKGESAFLQDANSIALKTEKLAEVIGYLKEKFPQIQRITSYGRADTLSRLSLDGLKMLKDAGLNRIHSGYESGSDQVLKLIRKGCTKAQEIEGGQKVKEAGIQLSVYYMPGVGGAELSVENSSETAEVINQVNPDFVRVRTFVAKPSCEIQQDINQGLFKECSDLEKAYELRRMITLVNRCDGTLVSDHIVNLFENVKGNLKTDKEKMLAVFEEFEGLSQEMQRQYQLARRFGMVRAVSDMKTISPIKIAELDRLCQDIKTKEQWEEEIKELVQNYI